MAQIFHPAMNPLSKATILGAVFILAGIAYVVAEVNRSPWVTQVDVVRQQPVQFTHAHHVSGLGIDCRYCHTSVETAATAGIPSTDICMNCHTYIWSDSPTLAPVRESLAKEESLRWTRVHDLADFAYFDHSIHIAKGVGCSTCHGRVDQMPLMWKTQSLQMEWCLNCHRHPEKYVRPHDQVFNMQWQPPPDQLEQGKKLVEERKIENQTSCSTCHR